MGWLSLERGLLHKPDDGSSVPRTHIKEAENQLHTVVATHALWYTYIPTYIGHIIIIIIIIINNNNKWNFNNKVRGERKGR